MARLQVRPRLGCGVQHCFQGLYGVTQGDEALVPQLGRAERAHAITVSKFLKSPECPKVAARALPLLNAPASWAWPSSGSRV